MKTIFQNRRANFHALCLKYLKYVLNDHFVLVMMFLAGFVMFQYRELLAHFPENHWPVALVTTFLLLLILPVGRVATFVEPSDKLFLIPKEEDLKIELKSAQRRAYILWGSVQLLVLGFLSPILVRLGLSWFQLIGLALLQLVLKYMVLRYQVMHLMPQGSLAWDKAILAEKKRQQGILTFFALFTNVKGISTSVKRRAYLDVILKYIPKKSDKLWLNLYARAFLRSGDYLALSLRLLMLSLLVISFIQEPLVAVGLTLLFNYLLLFQLLALYGHYDYHYLTELYPVEKSLKKTNLLIFLRLISVVLVVVEGILMSAGLSLLLLLGGMLILVYGYLPHKLNKMID